MPPSMNRLVDHLRRTAGRTAGELASDGDLLERFVTERDPLAFELLLRRHAPMVLGVCQRVIGNHHDAEDAFQATFLVLVRKAARIRPREAVGTWLYGVAYRTALGARSRLARRRAREMTVACVPATIVEPDATWHDLRPILDRELSALPEKYRLPLILCDLEGRGRKEVARALVIPEGTLSSRLATGRKLLAARLTRRGITLSATALAALLAQNSVSAAVPGMLLLSTTQAALVFAAGPAAAAGMVPGPVAALTEEVMRMMFMAKLKLAAAVVVGVTAVGLGTGALLYQARAGEGDGPSSGAPLVRQDSPRQHRNAASQKRDNAQKREAELLDQLKRARAEAEAARQEAIAQRQQAEAERHRAEAVLRQAEAKLKVALLAEAKARHSSSETKPAETKIPPSLSMDAQKQRLAKTEAELMDKFERERQRLQKEQVDLMAHFSQQRQKLLAEQDRLDAEQQARVKELRARMDKLAETPPKWAELPRKAPQRKPEVLEASHVFPCRYISAADAASMLQKLLGQRSDLRIIPTPSTNDVLVVGPESIMKWITNLMKKIDTPGREAQPAASRDQFHLILERLDRLEQRLDRIEHRQENRTGATGR